MLLCESGTQNKQCRKKSALHRHHSPDTVARYRNSRDTESATQSFLGYDHTVWSARTLLIVAKPEGGRS